MYPTARDAVAELERRHGPRSAMWTYCDGNGEPMGVIARWDRPGSPKDIRPASLHGTTWRIGGMPTPRPLYRLPELGDAHRVYVCEGEKAADAVRALGPVATTSPHGSGAADRADWVTLAGKDCVVLPDNDNAGRKYAGEVVRLLTKLTPAPTVKRIELPGLPTGGDAVEYIAARRATGLDDAAICRELERLADSAEAIELDRPAPAVEQYRPFPVEILPHVLARFVRETAAALGCESAYVALPTLCTTAAAIGTTRAVELKQSWREHAIVWAGLVARSGTLKTPAFDAAVKALRDMQIDALREYEAAADEYECERLEYERTLATWRKGKAGGDPPTKPQPPTPRRVIVSDATIEALAPILETNPRGVLLARDELAAWVRGFDAYKAKGRGGDAAAWLELWRAGTLIVDRKTGDKPTLYVPRAAVSVCGTIQPGVLADVLTAEHFENGLAARLLLAQPPELVKRWTERTPSAVAVRDYERLICDLLALKHAEGERGPEPIRLPLSDDARRMWASWYDRHAKRIARADGDREAAALAKIEAYAARFGLLFALAADPAAGEVPDDAMRRGIALADWFAGETARVYGLLAESDEDRERRRLGELIACKGGQITARELRQCCRRFRHSSDAAEQALNELADAGFGTWEQPGPGPKGGRPTRVFVLSAPSTDNETPVGDSQSAGFVDVDAASRVHGDGLDRTPPSGPVDAIAGGCPVDESPPLGCYPEANGPTPTNELDTISNV